MALTYQHIKDGVELSNGGDISGATSNEMTVANVAAEDYGNYSIRVTDTNTGRSRTFGPIEITAPGIGSMAVGSTFVVS